MQSHHLRLIGAILLLCLTTLRISAQSFWIQNVGTITTDSVTVADSALLVITGEAGGVYYTMDGTDPTRASTPYTAPISLSYGTHDIRALTYSADLSQELRNRLVIIVSPVFALEVRTPFTNLVTVSSIPRPRNGKYFSNSVVTITARSGGGWLFKEFRDMQKSSEDQIRFHLRSNVYVSLAYETPFNAMHAGPGTVTVDPVKERYEFGEQVTLHANPNPRCFFTSWSVGNQFAPWVHTITEANQTVTGNFQQAQEGQFVLHTDVIGGGGIIGTSVGRFVFFPGETVTVTCGRINGAFYGWLEGIESSNRTVSIQMNSDLKVVAHADRIFKWSKELERGSKLQPPAVAQDGTIYVASKSYLWTLSPEGEVQSMTTAPGPASPAVGPSGSIYVASTNEVASYQPDGALRWRYPGGRAPVAIDASENIYFLEGTQLVSLSKDRELRWKSSDRPLTGSPVISRNGVILVLQANTLQTRAYNLDGVYLWSGPPKNFPFEASIGADGTFAFQAFDLVHSLSESGMTNWTVRIAPPFDEKGITIAPNGDVHIGFSQMFVEPTPREVYTISSAGEIIQVKRGFPWPPLVDAAGLLAYLSPYAGTHSNIDLVDADGSYIFQAQVQGAGSRPTFGVDNTIYYISGSSLNAVSSLNGPMMNTWTTYRGNPQRTGSILPQTMDLPPSLPIIDGQTAVSGGSVQLEILVSDDNTPAEGIQLTAVSLDEALVPDENLVITGEGSSRTLSIAIPQDVTGTVRIRVTASDAAGLSVEREFLIQIEAPLPAPELLINLVPALTVKGVPGEQYRIEAQPNIVGAEWVSLTEVTLTNELQHVYVDLSVLGAAPRFYRAVLIE